MKKIDLEEQYQLYLGRVALNESTMHPEQKIQLRQTFFGAVGQFLILLENNIADMEEDDAVACLENCKDQVAQYFLSRTISEN